MSRLVIDVSGEQHQKIKALAALQGKSIKNFILDRVFSSDNNDEQKAWDELETMLLSRIEEAKSSGISPQSFEQITKEIITAQKSS